MKKAGEDRCLLDVAGVVTREIKVTSGNLDSRFIFIPVIVKAPGESYPLA